MDLTTILTIASQFMQVAVALVQGGRSQATADEVAALRAATQSGIAAIETDAAGVPAAVSSSRLPSPPPAAT